jgi:hypothetical protein
MQGRRSGPMIGCDNVLGGRVMRYSAKIEEGRVVCPLVNGWAAVESCPACGAFQTIEKTSNREAVVCMLELEQGRWRPAQPV